MGAAPATEDGQVVSAMDAQAAIEQVVPRRQLAEAMAVTAATVPEDDGDDDA